MLDRCDRVQIAVHDAAKAAQRFGQLLGSQVAVRDHSRHLEGLMTAGYCTADLDNMVKRWEGLVVAYDLEVEQLYLSAETTFGLARVISASTYRPRVGPVWSGRKELLPPP